MNNPKLSHENRKVDIYNPDNYSSVKSIGNNQSECLDDNLPKYMDFSSWMLWYPDLFLDLIKPKDGGITLHADQRIFLRCMTRFSSMYGVFSRGYGKTFDEVLGMFVLSVRYPNMKQALTAQTKENAAELLKDKYNEITEYYPWFLNEIKKTSFSKNDAEIVFVNNSRIDILANAQSSKGQRRRRIQIEEAAQVDAAVFEDALAPIVEVGRTTVGKLAIVNPEEMNQQINFFTTSWFKGCDEYNRNVKFFENMVDLNGDVILGASWQLPCWYGRGSSKQQIIKKKKTMTPLAFALNYESRWVGSVENALVNINKLMATRNLVMPKTKQADLKEEFYIGVDVARSQEDSNNKSSVVVVEVKRNANEKIVSLDLVNLINISNTMNFTGQAIEIKRIKKEYNAKMVVVDGNGLGSGLCDELMKDAVDPRTGENLGCWNTVNTDAKPQGIVYEDCLYDLKSQGINTEIIVNFISMIDGGILRLLEKKQDLVYDINDKDNFYNNIMPFLQTDLLIEEITNLQLKHLPNGNLTVERIVKKTNKDRYSALAYVLWYIKTYKDSVVDDDNDFCFFFN